MTAALAHGTSSLALTNRQVDMIRRTIAADCNNDEFSLYIEIAKRKQLDPFTRQCFPLVFNKNNKDKRRMTIIVSQDGLRALAARTADYRPDENEPVFEYDPSLKGPLNPAGIVKVTTTLWKMDTRGVWHPVKGWAYWDELAAIKEEWANIDGKWQPTGGKSLDGNWPKMPRIMIAKCATVNGLRAGWPDTYGGLYAEEEMDKARAEMTAIEMVEAHQAEQRQLAANIKNDEYPCVGDDGNLLFISAGSFVDHFLAIARDYSTPGQHDTMLSRNREAMTRFWAHHKDDALALKTELEKLREKCVPTLTFPADVVIPLPDPLVTATSLGLDLKTRFMTEQFTKIDAFKYVFDLNTWVASPELTKMIQDFELTEEDKRVLRSNIEAKRASLRK